MVDVMVGVLAVEVVVVVADAWYSNVVVAVRPLESVAVMRYGPHVHGWEPPTCVVYEKVPEAVTAWVEESSTVEDSSSCTVMETLSGSAGVG